MAREKLISTVVLVALVAAGALGLDYITSVILRVGEFTPLNTLLISVVVTTPVGYYLISQRVNIRRIKEDLAGSIAAKDLAVAESLRRQEEAQEALDALRKSEELYRLLADNQSDVISLWSKEGQRIYSSPSAERAFGFTPDEMRTLPESANAHPDDLPILREIIGPTLPGGPPRSGEYRLMHKDGSAIWVEGTFQRLNDGSEGLLSATRVITERKALQGELISALAEAKAAVVAKSDFLANMTHELRTPLNAIVGFSGLLKTSPDLTLADARQVGLVHDAAQTLLGVVNDVLDFSKLEAGAVEFDPLPFDPVEMAASTAAMVSEHAARKGLTINVVAEGLDGLLIGDGPHLRQVLLNFLSNAVKFTAEGDIELRLSQSEAGGQRRLRMSVKDSGIGVAPDQIDNIFGRFTQGDASVSRRYGGTGLGLAISKRIIDALGGDIGATSRPGEGSTFWFEVTLPDAGEVDAGVAGLAEPEKPDEGLRLLVVDDNAVNRELVCALLAPFDLTIDTACDGVEAVAAASAKAYDIILMDVQMPNMDGLTATARIRADANPGARRIPIIAMTANVLPEQVARCLEAGMDDHLGKPINAGQLLETLGRWSAPDDGAAATAAA